jgi:uncharacterized protein YacL (UPF0231 family)
MFISAKHLRLNISKESIMIFVEKDEQVHKIIAAWTLEEVEQDPTLAMTIATAVHMMNTDPAQLAELFGFHTYKFSAQ